MIAFLDRWSSMIVFLDLGTLSLSLSLLSGASVAVEYFQCDVSPWKHRRVISKEPGWDQWITQQTSSECPSLRAGGIPTAAPSGP